MSIEIMTEVWKHAHVDQGTLLVLLALADSADERSRSCYPGIDGLAAKSRLSERQVQYCIQRLREIGIVEVTRNASPVKTNVYRITEIAKWEQARDAIIAPHAKKPDTQSATGRDATHFVSDTQPIAPKPSVTSVIEPSDVREADLFSAESIPTKKTDEVLTILLEVLPEQTAKDWIAHRKALKKPLTPQGARLLVGKLREAANPVACVEASIMNGWQGVFPERAPPVPEKPQHYGGHRRSAPWGEIVR